MIFATIGTDFHNFQRMQLTKFDIDLEIIYFDADDDILYKELNNFCGLLVEDDSIFNKYYSLFAKKILISIIT